MYWSDAVGLSGQQLRDALHALLDGHTVVPYTSTTTTDVWDALMELDADPANASNVIEIYTQRSVPKSARGLHGWNREHLYPRSYGVGNSGPDTSDLHALRPSDWGVNSARSNKYFAECRSSSGCTVPAHVKAPDTGATRDFFMPPASVRGDIARSMFYMAVRYDGAEPATSDLGLSDAPSPEMARMGLLTDLLRWHEDDPPDDGERARNTLLCANFQGNRNPFVDHPEWVASVPWRNDTTPPSGSGGAGSNHTTLQPGDVAVTLIHLSPDRVSIALLVDLPAGAMVALTDSGWFGGQVRHTEGELTLTVGGAALPAGSVVQWDESSTSATDASSGQTVGTWSKTGRFALSASGDQLLIFTGSLPTPALVWALTTQGTEWSPPGSTGSSTTSELPSGLVNGETAVAVGQGLFCAFRGPLNGTRHQLQRHLANATMWVCSNDEQLSSVAALHVMDPAPTIPAPGSSMNSTNGTTTGDRGGSGEESGGGSGGGSGDGGGGHTSRSGAPRPWCAVVVFVCLSFARFVSLCS